MSKCKLIMLNILVIQMSKWVTLNVLI
jgi:hypothetical protein